MIFIFLILAANAQDVNGQTGTSALILRWSAYILAILAGITDLLDGYIARKWNQVTDFGALMDPLADKIFVAATMLVVVEYRLMPAWIAVVVISREFLVTGLRMLAVKKGEVISADRWGKLKTFLQMVMLLVAGASWIHLFDLHTLTFGTVKAWTIWMLFLWAIACVTVMSGLGYFIRYRHLYLDESMLSSKKS
jgi:CDP-diacylglycerol--glycerol-3-phosphate 3-phosphatidyltransferase